MNRGGFAFAAALFFAASPAAGKDGTDIRAREQFQAGRAAYAGGQYERALSSFSAAYGLEPIPSLLFDIAQCHRQLGNFDRAAMFYQQYLELSPETQNAARVRALLSEMQATERERKRQITDGDKVRRAILKSSQQTAPLQAVPVSQRPSPELTRSGASDDSSIFQRWWFWTGAGAITLATTAFILVSHASSSAPDAPLIPTHAR